MKITDVTLTLFAWENIPATIYGTTPARPTGKSELGLLRVDHRRGDRGTCLSRHLVEPGEPRRPGADPLSEADPDGPEPARPRAAQSTVSGRAHACADGPRDRRGRHRAVGHRRQGRRAADPSPARHLPQERAGLCPLRRSIGLARGLCRAGAAVQGDRLARLQDPPAAALATRTSRCARRCARRSATTTRSCSIRPGATATRRRCGSGARSRRWGSTGTRTRSPNRTSTTTSSSGRSSTSRSWRPNIRSAASIIRPVDHASAPPTTCAATSRSRAASPR